MDILKEFEGSPLELEKLSTYEKWALGFFHNEEEILDPEIDVTIQFDITDADKHYRKAVSKTPGASLTAYLYWSMIEAMKLNPCFLWRKIDGAWYHFKNLPLTFPIIVGGNERFNDLLIKNVCKMGWEEFCRAYREKVDGAIKEKAPFDPVPYDLWRITIFIGNQPDLQFTAMSLHKQVKKTGRSLFYFGKRYESGARLLVPLFINFDHSNIDPYVMDKFFKDYQRILKGELEHPA